MIAALVSFKSPLATRPMTSPRSSSRLLMAVLYNQTSSGWRSQSKGTFLKGSEGDIIIKFQHCELLAGFLFVLFVLRSALEPHNLPEQSPPLKGRRYYATEKRRFTKAEI